MHSCDSVVTTQRKERKLAAVAAAQKDSEGRKAGFDLLSGIIPSAAAAALRGLGRSASSSKAKQISRE